MTDWIIPDGQDVLCYRAFLYRITLPDGRFYVGKKNVYRTSGGKIVEEAKWKDYWSSSKEVKKLAKAAGFANCKREILQLLESVGKASYVEDRWLIENSAMLNPRCLNANIARKYNRKVVQGWHSDERCERYMADTRKQRIAAGLIE